MFGAGNGQSPWLYSTYGNSCGCLSNSELPFSMYSGVYVEYWMPRGFPGSYNLLLVYPINKVDNFKNKNNSVNLLIQPL